VTQQLCFLRSFGAFSQYFVTGDPTAIFVAQFLGVLRNILSFVTQQRYFLRSFVAFSQYFVTDDSTAIFLT
jgi:hypothetical protein